MIPPLALRALLLHAEGLTLEEAAERLGVSVNTVKDQLADTRKRWGALNTAHLLWLLACAGVVRP